MAQNSTFSSLAGSCFRTCWAYHYLSVNCWSALDPQRVNTTSKVPHLLMKLNNAFEMLSNRFSHWHAFWDHMHYAECLWTLHADAPRSSHVWGWRVSWWALHGWSCPSRSCSAPLKISGGNRQNKLEISEIDFLFIEENNSAACSDGRVFRLVAIVKVLGTFYKHG